MRKVVFVPAEAAARAQHPGVRFVVNTAASPYRGGAGGRRALTVPEADQRCGAQGWVRLAELPAGEQRRWREAFRKAKPCRLA